MPKTPKPPNVSRERILEAASYRFGQNGYAGTTLNSIAADLGITTPAIYWHFTSKEELFFTAIEQALVSFVTYVRNSVDAPDPVSRLAQTVTAHVTWQLEHADVASVYAATVGMKALLSELSDEHQAKLVSIQRKYMRGLRSTLVEGRECGLFEYSDEKFAAYAIVTMCEYPHVWFNPEGPLTIGQATRQMVVLALRSVGVDEDALGDGFFETVPEALVASTPG